MRLRELRERKSLTQSELAELAGLSQSVVCALERKERTGEPSELWWSTAARLSYALGERPEDVFGLPLPFKQPLAPKDVRKFLMRAKRKSNHREARA